MLRLFLSKCLVFLLLDVSQTCGFIEFSEVSKSQKRQWKTDTSHGPLHLTCPWTKHDSISGKRRSASQKVCMAGGPSV